MKVKVIPKKPIPGILPKNKWIDTEMELDLNKKEIMHCMQFGIVYDESGNMIDSFSIKKVPVNIIKVEKPIIQKVSITNIEPIITKVKEIGEEEKVVEVLDAETTTVSIGEPITIDMSNEKVPEVITTGPIEFEPVEEVIEESFCNLDIVSCIKENEYIILETQLSTNTKLEGNLYGLFLIISGDRPSSLEFNVGNEWFKFNNKFANFTYIENNSTFLFRFIPKNENEFGFKILIKESNVELAKLESKINPLALS